MSDLSPLSAQKRKLNVTAIWTALAICCVALIVAAAFWGLTMAVRSPNVGLKWSCPNVEA
jgi:hypothetical protein